MVVTKNNAILNLYKDYPEMPYISPERDIDNWLNKLPVKKVPKKNMVRLNNGLLPGDIILLWLINFGTHTTETHIPKYFEYTYGVDAKHELSLLIDKGYVEVECAFDSLNHVNGDFVKSLLVNKGVTGLSAMKRDELDKQVARYFSEEELATTFSIRGLKLTKNGLVALQEGQAVVDKHPKKKF